MTAEQLEQLFEKNQFSNAVWLQIPDNAQNAEVHTLWRAEYAIHTEAGVYQLTNWGQLALKFNAQGQQIIVPGVRKYMPWARNTATTVVVNTTWTNARLAAVAALTQSNPNVKLVCLEDTRLEIVARRSM